MMSLSYNENIRNRMIWLSLVVYIISLFMVHHYEIVAPYSDQELYSTSSYMKFEDVPGGMAVPKWKEFILTFIFWPGDVLLLICRGRMTYSLLWIIDLIYFIVLFRIYRYNIITVGTIKTMGLSILMAMLFQFSHYEIWIPMNESFVITQRGSGYYCWIMSLLILLCAMSCKTRYRLYLPVQTQKNKGSSRFDITKIMNIAFLLVLYLYIVVLYLYRGELP